MANRVKVQILGSTYYVTTNDSEDHMHDIERQISDALSGIMDAKPGLSLADALVMLCLNLTDELSKNESSTDRMREQLSEYLEDAAKARMELDDARRGSDRLEKELERARQSGGEAAALREKNEALRSAAETAKSETLSMQKQLEAADALRDQLRQEADGLREKNEALRSVAESAKNETFSLQKQLEAAETLRDQLRQEADELTAKNASLQKDIESLLS